MTNLAKAYLALVDPPASATAPSIAALTAQAASNLASKAGIVIFDFNPKELQLSKNANWQRQPQTAASQAAMPQFGGAQPASMTLDIFLDDSGDDVPSVPRDVQILLDAVTPTKESINANAPTPPWVVFCWGIFSSFVAVVKQVSAKYTMFKPDGTPVRASCTVQLEEVPTQPLLGQNPTSGGLAASRTHQLVEGDSLQSVAQREYGDAGRWRDIAELNGIDDPFRLVPGRSLIIPASSELDHAPELAPALIA